MSEKCDIAGFRSNSRRGTQVLDCFMIVWKIDLHTSGLSQECLQISVHKYIMIYLGIHAPSTPVRQHIFIQMGSEKWKFDTESSGWSCTDPTTVPRNKNQFLSMWNPFKTFVQVYVAPTCFWILSMASLYFLSVAYLCTPLVSPSLAYPSSLKNNNHSSHKLCFMCSWHHTV